MTVWQIVWVVVIVAAVSVFVVLVARQLRSGKGTPGIPTDIETGTHDEPVEDTAKVLDSERHARSAHSEVEEYRDVRRSLGD